MGNTDECKCHFERFAHTNVMYYEYTCVNPVADKAILIDNSTVVSCLLS